MKRIRSGIIPKIVVAVVIVYALVTIIVLRVQIADKAKEKALLSNQIEVLSEENASLKERISREFTESEIRQLARERLGLVGANDEIVYNISSGN